MRKRFPFPKVSDALNGVVAIGRQASQWNPLTIHKKSRKAKAIFALVALCIVWGTTWVASKIGVQYMPALQMAGLRQVLGGLLYLLYFVRKRSPFPKGKEWMPILVLSFLNFMLSNGLSTWGVKYISAGLGAIIGATFPLWLVIILAFRSKGGLKRNTVLGLMLGFAGICVIFYEHLHDFFNPQFRFGIFISLIAAWSWAIGTLYTKQHALTFNPYLAMGLQMVISGLVLYTVSVLSHNSVPVTAIPWQSWASIGYLIIFSSVLSFVAYLYALQNLPTEQVSIYAYVNPVVAFLIGALLFGEKITLIIVAGFLITLYGVYKVNRSVAENVKRQT